MCLEKHCIEKLLQTHDKFSTSDLIIKHVLYVICNLCRGKPNPNWETILPALPLLYKHISEVHSQEALKSALWSLSCITGTLFKPVLRSKSQLDDKIQEVIDQGCLPFLMHHL